MSSHRDLEEDVERLKLYVPNDRFITRAEITQRLADPDFVRFLDKILTSDSLEFSVRDNCYYAFDRVTREAMISFEDGDIILAPGDSPIRVINHANLLYADEPVRTGMMNTYHFTIDKIHHTRRLQFIAFPLSGLGGRVALGGDKIQLLGTYLSRILDSHGVPIGANLSFIDSTHSGGTPRSMGDAIRTFRGPTFEWKSKYNLRKFETKGCSNISQFLSAAEGMGARCLASHKDYSKDPVKFEYEDVFGCNALALISYYKAMKYVSMEIASHTLVEMTVKTGLYDNESKSGRFMVTESSPPSFNGFWIDDPMSDEEEYNFQDISYFNPLRKIEDVGLNFFVDSNKLYEVHYSYGKVYHSSTTYIKEIYANKILISPYNSKVVIPKIETGTYIFVDYFDESTQQILHLEGVYKVGSGNTSTLNISVAPSNGIGFKEYLVQKYTIQSLRIGEKIDSIKNVDILSKVIANEVTYYNGVKAKLSNMETHARSHTIVDARVLATLMSVQKFENGSIYRITTYNVDYDISEPHLIYVDQANNVYGSYYEIVNEKNFVVERGFPRETLYGITLVSVDLVHPAPTFSQIDSLFVDGVAYGTLTLPPGSDKPFVTDSWKQDAFHPSAFKGTFSGLHVLKTYFVHNFVAGDPVTNSGE